MQRVWRVLIVSTMRNVWATAAASTHRHIAAYAAYAAHAADAADAASHDGQLCLH